MLHSLPVVTSRFCSSICTSLVTKSTIGQGVGVLKKILCLLSSAASRFPGVAGSFKKRSYYCRIVYTASSGLAVTSIEMEMCGAEWSCTNNRQTKKTMVKKSEAVYRAANSCNHVSTLISRDSLSDSAYSKKDDVIALSRAH